MIRGVLFDLSGTIHTGDRLIPGAADAIQRLRDSGRRVRFVTNTSTKSSRALLEQLQSLGLELTSDELITSVLATRNYLLRNNLRPFCLLEDTDDFVGVELQPPHDCVIVGLAPSKLNYEAMNQAFRVLQQSRETPGQSPRLIAIHKGPYIRDKDGELSLGPGGFCSTLEVAANCTASVMGKPSSEFFQSALWEDISPSETCMVGDDALQDIAGARAAGIGMGILVQTGKYQTDDESKVEEGIVSRTCPSIVEAIDFILKEVQHHRRLR